MILSKDLQEILEGVHYFLAEALTRESLSGRAECLRRGLVLQLEALTGAYPTLRICPAPQGTPRGGGVAKGGSSSASLPYLPMDQLPVRSSGPPTTTTTTSTTYSSSSSGVNSSSSSNSGSSGDGQRIGPGAPFIEEGGGGQSEEVYEEFDDYKDEGVEIKPEKGGGGGGGGGGGEEAEEKEEEDGVYTETHEPIPFSSLIATCEKHGALGKKTKGLLRNIKSYLCVVAGGMLYLYVKDTDDRQKKSIDLAGYTARSATGEEIKDTKKKDAAFEIVCPGRKTHTFIARTAKDKNEWLDALSRTIRGGKPRPFSSPSHAPLSTPLSPMHISLPLKPPSAPAPPPTAFTTQQEEEYCLYNDVEEEELYEEIQGEEQGGGLPLPPPPASLLSPSPTPHAPPYLSTATTTTTSQPAYDPVESEPLPTPGTIPPRPPPPSRPPLPTHTQTDTQQKPGEDSDDSQDIYCEIEEEDLENARKAYSEESGAADRTSRISNIPMGPFKVPVGGLGSLSKEIFKSLDATTITRPQADSQGGPPAGPPRLPPKGVVAPEAEESEYKVPQNSDTEYHVPSSMPVSAEATKAPGNKISGPLPLPNMLGVSQAPTILPIKPVERRNSVAEDKKAGVSSFRTGDQDLTRGPKAAKGTSVRDMIARLNQRKQENDDPKEEDEEKITTSTSNASSSPSSISSTPSNPPLSLPKQNLKPYKPPLPSRPQNMRAGGSVSPNPSKEKGVEEEEEEKKKKEEEEEEKKEEEEEEEIYDVLDDDDDASPQQQAEWYVAKFAFVATLDQALSFGRGDEILVYDTSGTSGWWRATLRGRNGLVPREYLKKKE